MRMLTALVMGLLLLPAPLTLAQESKELPAAYQAELYAEQEIPRAPEEYPSDDDEAPSPTPEREAFRVQNSEFGAAGGVHVLDAGAGLPGTFRLQLSLAYFGTSDFLELGDEVSRTGGVLSLGWTLTDYLELFGSIANRATSNSKSDPALLQVLGDVLLGVKGYHQLLPWLVVGGDLSLTFLNSVGDIGLRLDSTNIGLRANATADLRQLEDAVPLLLRANLSYVFDNAAILIEGVEKARTAADRESSEASYVSRAERFGLGINRVDHVGIGLGVEVPLAVTETLSVHPLAEYTLNVGVNRQGYSCLVVATSAGAGERDGCLALQGLAAMPATLTLGARVFTPVEGLSALLAADIGLTGTSTFVRELSPNAPYELRFAVGYAYDPSPAVEMQQVEVVREVQKAPPPLARLDGSIVDKASGAPVAAAIVRYVGQELTAQASDGQGHFVSYGLPEGLVELDVSHPDYEPGSCSATMPAPGLAFVPREVVPVSETLAPAPGAATITALGPVDAQGNRLAGEGAIDFNSTAPGASGQVGQQVELGANAGIGATTVQGAPPPAGARKAPVENPSPAVAVRLARGEGAFVPLVCTLVAKPRLGGLSGSVVDETGAPVPAVNVHLSGPTVATLTTDGSGGFTYDQLDAGAYTVRVDAPLFMLKSVPLTIEPAASATLRIELTRKPKQAQVQMSSGEVKIRRQIMFKTNSAEIRESSHILLREIADVLQRSPEVELVEIQGHTDNRGDAALNRQLSQLRAESVRNFLVAEGVAPGRLDAKGYGDIRPLVPNLTEANRARNRRVQFMIRKRSSNP